MINYILAYGTVGLGFVFFWAPLVLRRADDEPAFVTPTARVVAFVLLGTFGFFLWPIALLLEAWATFSKAALPDAPDVPPPDAPILEQIAPGRHTNFALEVLVRHTEEIGVAASRYRFFVDDDLDAMVIVAVGGERSTEVFDALNACYDAHLEDREEGETHGGEGP